MRRLGLILALLCSLASAQWLPHTGPGAHTSSSPIPIPPGTASVFSNLQTSTNFVLCANYFSGCRAGTPSCVGTSSYTVGNAVPSLSSGGSLKLTNTTNSGSPEGCNVLLYNHLGCTFSNGNTCANITNMLLDIEVNPQPTPGRLVGYEFDPDVFTEAVGGNWTTKASIACYSSNNHWHVYNQSGNLPTGGAWESTPYPCTLNSTDAGKWNHIQLWVTIDQTAHTYTFQALVYNGVTVIDPAHSITYNSWNNDAGKELNMETQIDNTSTPGTNIGYYDNWTFTVWHN